MDFITCKEKQYLNERLFAHNPLVHLLTYMSCIFIPGLHFYWSLSVKYNVCRSFVCRSNWKPKLVWIPITGPIQYSLFNHLPILLRLFLAAPVKSWRTSDPPRLFTATQFAEWEKQLMQLHSWIWCNYSMLSAHLYCTYARAAEKFFWHANCAHNRTYQKFLLFHYKTWWISV